ncbi:hypothetical protein Tco_1261971, partial [Tanacetum coccineum]
MNLSSKPTMSADVNKENSYASLVRPNVATKVHFRTLVNEEKVDNFDCVLPKIAAAKVMRRFEKITRNDEGVYLFKFASKSGNDEGYIEVKSHKKKKGADSRSFGGLRMNKPNSKGSEQVNSDFNVNNKKDHEPSSSKSACNDVHKDKNVSSYPELKKWDCINESDTDDDDVIPSYGSFLGGGNIHLEMKIFDFSMLMRKQEVDLP